MAYIPEIETLADIPRFHMRVHPNSPAVDYEGTTITYSEWGGRCMRVGNGLIGEGVKPGGRIAVLDKNTDSYFEVLFGAAVAGAVTVSLNWRLAPAELAFILNDAGAEVLFVCGDFADLAQEVLKSAGTVRSVIALSGGAGDWKPFARWRDSQSATDPGITLAPTSTAVQMYTSGTTGNPKGVELSHQNFYALDRHQANNPEERVGCFEWSPGDVNLVTMPVFHISGTGYGVLGFYNGAKNVILPQFEAGSVLRTIEEHRVTKLVLVPAAIQMLLQHPQCRETDFSSIDYLFYGASPIPLALIAEAAQVFRCGLVQLYGLTEVCGAVTYLPAEDHVPEGNERMRSAGKPLPGVSIEIRDEQGSRLKSRQVGEVCIHSPSRMVGYWQRSVDTAATIDEAGWLRSGDAGYLDEDGYVYIHDRVKDMIVSGGENIYPAEVENAIFGHPDVAEVAVIGVPDDRWGEAVKAIVAPKPDTQPDGGEIIEWARERIAGYKLPKSVDFVDALPRNASGKILKRELREPYWTGRERRVN